MAVATTTLLAATAAASVGKGIYDTVSGAREAKNIQKKIDNYNRQTLENTTTGLSIPTSGIEMQKEQAQQTQADMADLLSKSQSASIGGAMALAEKGRISMKEIGTQLDTALFNLKQMQAEDEARIRSMKETREMEDIAGLGAEYAYQRSRRDAGLNTAIQTMGSVAEMAYDMEVGGEGGMDASRRAERRIDRENKREMKRYLKS